MKAEITDLGASTNIAMSHNFEIPLQSIGMCLVGSLTRLLNKFLVVKQLQIMIVIEISRVERKRTDLLNSKRTR